MTVARHNTHGHACCDGEMAAGWNLELEDLYSYGFRLDLELEDLYSYGFRLDLELEDLECEAVGLLG